MKNNNRNGKFNKKKYDRNYRDDDNRRLKSEPHNDISWYANNPQLVKDTSSLAFSNVLGTSIGLKNAGNADIFADSYVDKIPGICILKLEPSFGGGDTSIDAPTVAARNLYIFIRHANSGSVNYEAPDMMMMFMAHVSCQAWLCALRRVYGILKLYHNKNRYYGEALVRAMGFDYQDLDNNIADLRAYINLASAKLNSIKIPEGFSVSKRWNWLSTNYFTDDDAIKAQIYVPRFERYLKFSGYSSETGTELQFVSAPENATLATIRTFTESLIQPLYYEEDVGIMSGDVMKAFGTSVSSVPSIDENYTTLPVYNQDVLMQIHNAYLPTDQANPNLVHTITQSGGVIKEVCRMATTLALKPVLQGLTGMILDSYKDDPTADDVMISTRLMPVFDWSSDAASGTLVSSGTEFLIGIENVIDPVNNGYKLCTSFESALGSLTAMSMFNWHPIVYVTQNSKLFGFLGDMENYTVISKERLATIHRVAVLNELAVTTKTDVN